MAASFELLTAATLERVYANGLYWEPGEGAVEAVFDMAERGQLRMCDLGELATWIDSCTRTG